MADLPPARIERLPLASESEREPPLAKRKGKRPPRPREEAIPDISSGDDEESRHELDTLA